jgi:ribonuclease BN (tRNA processing enzyme)
VRLTVLGKSPSWQDAGGACSGYLVQQDDTSVLVDCGNGVFGKLRQQLDYVDLDAVIVSHMHADHWLDLIPYSYALTYAPKQQPVPVHIWPGTETPARPRLIAPPGATQIFRRVTGAWGNEELIENAFALAEYGAGDTVEVGPISATFHPVPHFIDTFAINLTADGHKLTYGADSRPGDELIEVARDADLILVEATLPRPERTGVRGHMTPEEAGSHAKRAGAKRVVITHISDELGDDWAREQAESSFGGPVEVAREGATYEI